MKSMESIITVCNDESIDFGSNGCLNCFYLKFYSYFYLTYYFFEK